MEILIIFLMVLIIVVIITAIIIRWLYKKLRKTKFHKYAFLLPTVIISFLVYEIYDAIYPDDDFYVEYFEYLSTIKFPASGVILYKDADYPDLHGNYSSVAIVRLKNNDYNKTLKEMINEKGFKLCHILYNTESFRKRGFKEENIELQYYKGELLVSFLADKKTILIQKGISDFSFADKASSVSSK